MSYAATPLSLNPLLPLRVAGLKFAPNPQLDVSDAITKLAVGEALASTLREGGVPSPVQQVLVTSPTSRIGAITEAERASVRQRSPVGGKYDNAVNRESAAEMLAARAGGKVASAAPAGKGEAAGQGPGWGDAVRDVLLGNGRRQGVIEAMAKSATRSIGSRLGTQIVRGVLGSIFGGKR